MYPPARGRRPPLALAGALLLVAACGGGGDGESQGPGAAPVPVPGPPTGDPEPTDACDIVTARSGREPALIQGDSCGDATSAVVLLELISPGGEVTGTCTGTAIAPRAVLTAAHCVVAAPGEEAIAFVDVIVGGRLVSSLSLDAVPGYDPDDLLSPDVGVVRVGEDLGLPTFPLLVSRSAAVGEEAVIVGFGLEEDGTEGEFKAGLTTVNEVGAVMLFTDFDGTGSNTCSGDSGGPLLVEEAGRYGVAAVTSSGTVEECTTGDRAFFSQTRHGGTLPFVLGVVPEADTI